MKDKLLSIGKMAAMNNISISTLRLYDEKGLLKPCLIDQESSYRYYDISQNARLEMIIYMKELGLSLAEIKDILDHEDASQIEALLAYKNEEISKQINSLKDQRRALNRAIESLERYRKAPAVGIFNLEYIPKRKILTTSCHNNFYDGDIHNFEEMLRDLRNDLTAAGLSQIHSYNIGTSIKKEDFLTANIIADQIFLFCDLKDNYNIESHLIDSGMWLCVYLDDYDDEAKYIKELKDYCAIHDYQVTGDYICEVMTGFNIFGDNPNQMFLRLQVPIAFNTKR